MSKFWRNGLPGTILFIVFFFSSCPRAQAAELQNLDSIRATVVKAMQLRLAANSSSNPYQINDTRIEVQKLDSRLRLANCDSDLEAIVPAQFQMVGRTSVEVRCDGSKPWKIYLQTSLFTQVSIPVLKQPLAAGSVISETDLDTLIVDLNSSSQSYVRSAEQLIGNKAKRHLNPGTAILISQIEAPDLIQRGQQVNLEYQTGGLVVRMAGRSNEDGAEGDWIRAVNINSGKTVEGRINAQGNVVVRN